MSLLFFLFLRMMVVEGIFILPTFFLLLMIVFGLYRSDLFLILHTKAEIYPHPGPNFLTSFSVTE